MPNADLISNERIEKCIRFIRGQKVILDKDLATLYEVPTKVFNQAVKRNLRRFPADFMFQLSADELENWRSQIVTSNPNARMSLRHRPYALTEQGVATLSSVLKSETAIGVNIAIMRAFVRLRQILSSQRPGAEAGRLGKEVRSPVRRCLRCHPSTDGSARAREETTDRLSTGMN